MTTFTDLALAPKVLKAVADAGYETPTPIQAGAIPAAIEGRDVLGIAQTGTGKTASFTLPMIHALARGRARARMPRSLVLCPTRELAAQVAENFDTYAKYVKLSKALLIGGVSFKEQDLLIDRGVDVLIATPGRLLDHFERGKLLLTGIEIMVVDEADRMLDLGFIPDIEMFRASRRDRAAKEKRDELRAIIERDGESCTNASVFSNRNSDVDIVAKSLKKHGYNAAPIHGDLEQSQRTKTLDAFRDGELKVLVASDVAARGLDIPMVSHVFNFDVPSHSEDYVHRIGRTGRAGRDGKAVMICSSSDEKNLSAIENLIKKEIPRAELETTKNEKPEPAKRPVEEPNAEPANVDAPQEKRGRGRGRGKGDGGPKVVGMGDHMPSFIAKSFGARKAS